MEPVLRSLYSILSMFDVICRHAQTRRPRSSSFRMYSVQVHFQAVPSGHGHAHFYVHVLKIFHHTRVGMHCAASKLQLLRYYMYGVSLTTF